MLQVSTTQINHSQTIPLICEQPPSPPLQLNGPVVLEFQQDI